MSMPPPAPPVSSHIKLQAIINHLAGFIVWFTAHARQPVRARCGGEGSVWLSLFSPRIIPSKGHRAPPHPPPPLAILLSCSYTCFPFTVCHGIAGGWGLGVHITFPPAVKSTFCDVLRERFIFFGSNILKNSWICCSCVVLRCQTAIFLSANITSSLFFFSL